MHSVYARELDLNLLRVFLVVARCGSVTQAAAELYLTQPAVSAALKRLRDAVGAPLFARRGRGLVLTARGAQLQSRCEPHLQALVEAALAPPTFDPRTSRRTLRLGLAEDAAGWLLPELVRTLGAEAPSVRLVVVPVQFRTIADALAAGRVDLAVTVADDLPADILRESLFRGRFVCLFDAGFGAPAGMEGYFARPHVIVSYNGDLRGIVEDTLGRARDVRCSVPSFSLIGAIVEGTELLGTLPERVAASLTARHPSLATCDLPFPLPGAPVELLVPEARRDDPAVRFLTGLVRRTASHRVRERRPRRS